MAGDRVRSASRIKREDGNLSRLWGAPLSVHGRPLRILHVTDNFKPTSGGLERAVDALTRAWVARGYVPAVATSRHPDAPDRENRGGVEVFRLPVSLARLNVYAERGRVFLPPVPDLEFSRALSATIAEHRPDVIHTHGWCVYSVLGPARRAHVPVVSTAHDYGQVCVAKTLGVDSVGPCTAPETGWCSCGSSVYGKVKGALLTQALRFAGRRHRQLAAQLAISQAVADAGSAMRPADRTPMRVVPTFIDASLLERAMSASRPSWVPDGQYVFFAGALSRHKGVDVLVDAYRKLRADRGDVSLVLAGLPRPHDPLMLNVPGLVQVTNRPHDEVLGAWRHAAVGVVPSRWPEALGQVAVEALAAACPLVVSQTGGLVDVADKGRAALLCRPGDPADLFRQLDRVLSDKVLASTLRLAGPEQAARFTLASVLPQVEDVYRGVLNPGGSSPIGRSGSGTPGSGPTAVAKGGE